MLVPLHESHHRHLPEDLAADIAAQGSRMLAFRLSDMELDDHVEAMLRHWIGDPDTDEAQPIDLQDQQHDEQEDMPDDGQEDRKSVV